MIPEFPDRRPLALEDRPALIEALGRSASATCDLSPSNLFIWRDSETTSVTRVGDSLCLLVEPRWEPPYFLEPLGGSRRGDAVRKCLTLVDRVSRAGRMLVDTLSPLEFEFRSLRDHFDYVYHTQVLSELKGKDFDSKRNHIRRFLRHCPEYEFRQLTPSLFGNALDLFDRWAGRQKRDGSSADSPAAVDPVWQRHALNRAFEGFEVLGLTGGAVMVRGGLQGFIIGTASPGRSAFVHFQYANTDIPGIYQWLLREACRILFAGCGWINLEEDLGLPGLRKTKLSYHPLRLEHKYEVLRREPKSTAAPAA